MEMYQFISSFLADSVPGRPFSTVKIVAGDGYFDQEMIVNFGYTSALFLMDHFHLRDLGLADMFGKSGYELLKGHLEKMIDAWSEGIFNEVANASMLLLWAQPVRDGILEQKLLNFASKRQSYAQYILDSIAGNKGCHGSSSCEQNHFSTLAFLNDGVQ